MSALYLVFSKLHILKTDAKMVKVVETGTSTTFLLFLMWSGGEAVLDGTEQMKEFLPAAR